MKQYFKDNYLFIIISAILLIFSLLIAVFLNNAYDDGDSNMHYLISHYALSNPILLLNHWGKPFFTLLSAPFAYFGFTGIKIFNCFVAFATAFIIYESAKKLDWNNSHLSSILLYATPGYFLCQFSGLTEPLFGLLLILGFYLYLLDKKTIALLIISFLPFVRSEGWIILIVYALFLCYRKDWKSLPLLLAGHIAYGIIGLIVFKNFLWMFHQNPYAGKEVLYGAGTWMHFIEQYPYITGIPLFIIYLIGLLLFGYEFIRKKAFRQNFSNLTLLFLVVGCSLAYLFAHIIFWKFGLFRSFGLKRVLIAIVPLNITVILYVFNYLAEKLNEKNFNLYQTIKLFVVLIIIAFPFIGNKASFKLPDDFSAPKRHQLIDKVFEWYEKKEKNPPKIYFSHPYIAIKFNLNPFDKSQSGTMQDFFNEATTIGSIVIFDDWFSYFECRKQADELKIMPQLELLQQYNLKQTLQLKENLEYNIYVFEVIK